MLVGAAYLGVFQISMRAMSRLPPRDQAGPHKRAASAQAGTQEDSRAVVTAAVLASVVVAVISGPLDMARNRKQAGLVAGPLLAYTFSVRGLGETLPFIGPFMLCSVPHDLVELLAYFQLSRAAQQSPEPCWWRGAASQEAVDAAVGAVAGAAGVLVSTPADCIKTKLITSGGPSRGATGVPSRGQLSWRGIATETFRRQGVPGLFVGVIPRMLDEVPGCMLHWVIAERCTRWLQGGEALECAVP